MAVLPEPVPAELSMDMLAEALKAAGLKPSTYLKEPPPYPPKYRTMDEPYMATPRQSGQVEYQEYHEIVTQKAQGVKAIRNKGYFNCTPNLRPARGPVYLFPHAFANPPDLTLGKWFGRPCPVTPRHGFVESREVKDMEDVKALFAEARKADPQAELMVMPRLSGEYSGVATAAGVTWGLSNDSVTGGKEAFHIPTPFRNLKDWKRIFQLETVPGSSPPGHNFKTKYPYVELVEDIGDVSAVQYRDGPEQPTTRDYIPHFMRVKKVAMITTPDLLEWEQEMKYISAVPGAVLYMPGGALSSHHAVHAIASGVPVITSKKPEVGDLLKPDEADSMRGVLSSEDYSKVAYLMERWLNKQTYKPYEPAALMTAIGSIHAQSIWGAEPHLLALRAYAFPTLLKFTAAAVAGELRHWFRNGPGGTDGARMVSDFNVPLREYDRADVYRTIMSVKSLERYIAHLTTIEEDFRHKGWGMWKPGHEEGDEERYKTYSYGGPKWANVACLGKRYALSIDNFLRKPTKENYKTLVLVANTLINAVHNGGYALSKWISQDHFMRLSATPGIGFLNPVAAKLVLGLKEPPKTVLPSPVLEERTAF